MRRRTPASILVLCSASLFWGCPDQTDDILGTLTVSASGALVTPSGRVLRARERREYAGHSLQLVRLDSDRRVERLLDQAGDVVRERQGTASDAQPQSQERSDGQDCSVFTDQDGVQVANSCAVPADTAQDQHCERLDTATADGDALLCTICYADDGSVLSRECHLAQPGDPCLDGSADCAPACDPNNPDTDCMPPPTCQDSADPGCVPPPVEACRLVHDGDRSCRVCLTADGQSFEECWQVPDPVRCEILLTDDGLECVYCFDAAGEVVERSCRPQPCTPRPGACTLMPGGCQSDQDCPEGLACFEGTCCTVKHDSTCPPPQPLRCKEFVTSDGAFCRVCYDDAGNVVDEGCEGGGTEPIWCEEVQTSNGERCTLCRDGFGNVVSDACAPVEQC